MVMMRVAFHFDCFSRGALQLGSFSWSCSYDAERLMRVDCWAPSVPRVTYSSLVSMRPD